MQPDTKNTWIDTDLGKNEFIAVPNVELGSATGHCGGYVTHYYGLLSLDGAYGNGGNPQSTASANSCERTTGWNTTLIPVGNTLSCQNCQVVSVAACSPCLTISGGYPYPPQAVPSVAFGDVVGNQNPELIFGFDDGSIVCYSGSATKVWSFNFASDLGINPQTQYVGMGEATLADLNQDGLPEVIFGTYGVPGLAILNQWMYILDGATGAKLFSVSLNDATTNPGSASNGNGNGPPGTPTVADVDGDGTLEILWIMFDGRLLYFSVPGSAVNCMPWPTGRGGYLRKGQNDAGVY